jgi:hypothetical protein
MKGKTHLGFLRTAFLLLIPFYPLLVIKRHLRNDGLLLIQEQGFEFPHYWAAGQIMASE